MEQEKKEQREQQARTTREGKRKSSIAFEVVEDSSPIDRAAASSPTKGTRRKPVAEASRIAGSFTDQGLKRKKFDESFEVIVSKPPVRPRPLVPKPPVFVEPLEPFTTSPAFSTTSLPFSSTSFDPPPSAVATSSTSSFASQPPLSLEVAILRSQLDAANENLRRERELAQRERERFEQDLQSAKAQFDRERATYLEYIQSLESRRT